MRFWSSPAASEAAAPCKCGCESSQDFPYEHGTPQDDSRRGGSAGGRLYTRRRVAGAVRWENDRGVGGILGEEQFPPGGGGGEWSLPRASGGGRPLPPTTSVLPNYSLIE